MVKVAPMMLVPPLAFAGLLALFLLGMGRDDPDALPSTIQGRQAPEISANALADLAVFDAEMLRGPGVKLVNFWASWCAPCRVEHPILQALSDEGVPIYGVNFKDKPEHALRFLRNLGNPYAAIVTDQTGEDALNWGVYGVPETFVIDATGVVILRHAGPVTQRVLDEIIKPAMDRAARSE